MLTHLRKDFLKTCTAIVTPREERVGVLTLLTSERDLDLFSWSLCPNSTATQTNILII